jgi:Arc/MetJ-type ribon-helix-helix transcriptional regulator
MKAFIEHQIAQGGYASASEYFHDLIREAQRGKAERELEAKLAEGLQRITDAHDTQGLASRETSGPRGACRRKTRSMKGIVRRRDRAWQDLIDIFRYLARSAGVRIASPFFGEAEVTSHAPSTASCCCWKTSSPHIPQGQYARQNRNDFGFKERANGRLLLEAPSAPDEARGGRAGPGRAG